MVEVPPHIQQMLYEIQLKAGIPQKLMEMQGLINDETTKELKKKMSNIYKSYLLAVLCFTVLAIVLMPFLYFTTAWSIAGFASIATFIFYKEYFYEE